MYDHELHLYNGRDKAPDPKEVAEHVMGAVIGYVVGSTLGYSFEGKPQQNPQPLKYLGGGPNKYPVAHLSDTTRMALHIFEEELKDGSDFGGRVKRYIHPDVIATATDLQEENFMWMLLRQQTSDDLPLQLCLGPIIMGHPHRAMTVARMVQNHPVTDAVLWDFQTAMRSALLDHVIPCIQEYYGGPIQKLMPQDGRITSTFNNAVLWVNSGLGFERTLELVLAKGGATTGAAGITGALLGAVHGVRAIPKRLTDKLPLESISNLGLAAARAITGI